MLELARGPSESENWNLEVCLMTSIMRRR